MSIGIQRYILVCFIEFYNLAIRSKNWDSCSQFEYGMGVQDTDIFRIYRYPYGIWHSSSFLYCNECFHQMIEITWQISRFVRRIQGLLDLRYFNLSALQVKILYIVNHCRACHEVKVSYAIDTLS